MTESYRKNDPCCRSSSHDALTGSRRLVLPLVTDETMNLPQPVVLAERHLGTKPKIEEHFLSTILVGAGYRRSDEGQTSRRPIGA